MPPHPRGTRWELGAGLAPRGRGRGRGRGSGGAQRPDASRDDERRGHGDCERGRPHPRGCLHNGRLSGPGAASSGTAAQSSASAGASALSSAALKSAAATSTVSPTVRGVERRLDRLPRRPFCRRDGRRRSEIWQRHGPLGQASHRRRCGGHGSRVGGNKFGRNCRSRVGGDRESARIGRTPRARAQTGCGRGRRRWAPANMRTGMVRVVRVVRTEPSPRAPLKSRWPSARLKSISHSPKVRMPPAPQRLRCRLPTPRRRLRRLPCRRP